VPSLKMPRLAGHVVLNDAVAGGQRATLKMPRPRHGLVAGDGTVGGVRIPALKMPPLLVAKLDATPPQ